MEQKRICFYYTHYNSRNDFLDAKHFVYTNEVDIKNEFSQKIMNLIPLFDDRFSIERKRSKEIDVDLLNKVIEIIISKFDLFNDHFLFEQNDKLGLLKIIVRRQMVDSIVNIKTNDKIIKAAIKEGIYKNDFDNNNSNFTFFLFYKSNHYTFNDNKNLKASNLLLSDLKIFEVLSKSNKPMTRSDITGLSGFSERTVDYSIKRLMKNNLIFNLNKSKANKLNVYITNEGIIM